MTIGKTIVCFYGYQRKPTSYNYHLHLGFFERAFKWHGYELVHHGPASDEYVDSGIPFDPRHGSLRKCIDEFKPVAVMVVERKSVTWALSQVPDHIPTIVYLVDLHRLRGNVASYAGADVVLLRAKQFEERIRAMNGGSQLGICKWLPFSVDTTLVDRVQPINATRSRDVVFCGDAREVYPLRRPAIEKLREAGLLSERSVVARRKAQRAPFQDYVARLKSSLIGLASTSLSTEWGGWRLNMAKHVEIPACGTCLMTNGGPGMDDLLPSALYLKYRDEQEAVELATKLLASDEGIARVRALGRQAHDYVKTHHDDRVRAEQLISFLRQKIGI